MSLRQAKILAIFIELLSGTFIMIASIYVLTIALGPRFEPEQLFWGLLALILIFVSVLTNMVRPVVLSPNTVAKGDLEHLLHNKPTRQKQTEQAARVSLGRFIRVGSPKPPSSTTEDPFERLVTIKKQGDWLNKIQ